MRDDLEAALREIKEAENIFNNSEEAVLIDQAIYKEEAARKKYSAIMSEIRQGKYIGEKLIYCRPWYRRQEY